MTWYGTHYGPLMGNVLVTAVYWGIVIFLIAATFFLVLLDIRFIRLQYALERRNLYKETLGSEQFRDSLMKGKQEPPDSESPPPNDR